MKWFKLVFVLRLIGCFLKGSAYGQMTANATPVVINGTVGAITVTDGGAGYSSPPTVTISGGGGSGTVAAARIFNGAVSEIRVIASGSGYTNDPMVTIASPFSLSSPGRYAGFEVQGFVGQTYEIQSATSLEPSATWTGVGRVVLTNSSQLFVPGTIAAETLMSQFYRAQPVNPAPLPRTATALSSVVNGEVLDATVADGGAGYCIPPTVIISGGGGSGAEAVAAITNGTVGQIVVTKSGAGYTSPPTVAISSPAYLAGTNQFAGFQVKGPNACVFEIQWATNLADLTVWASLAQLVVTNSGQLFVDTSISATKQAARFYRLQPLTNFVPRLVWIAPGTFTMGSPDSEQDRNPSEGPQTVVTLTRGFWMSQRETTQAEYQSVMGLNPSGFIVDPQRPVESVSWYDAANYCRKLTKRERAAGRLPTGYAYRLPTEAEWEYACRAGTTTRFSFGDDPDYTHLGDYAWYFGNSAGQTHPVGQKLPNAWGLYDMYGNVWEWCQDFYSNSLPGGSVTDPQGANSGARSVVRGGCWLAFSGLTYSWLRSACRGGEYSYHPASGIGFRPVLAPDQ